MRPASGFSFWPTVGGGNRFGAEEVDSQGIPHCQKNWQRCCFFVGCDVRVRFQTAWPNPANCATESSPFADWIAIVSEWKSIPKRTRFEVFKRDSFTCQYCGLLRQSRHPRAPESIHNTVAPTKWPCQYKARVLPKPTQKITRGGRMGHLVCTHCIQKRHILTQRLDVL